MSRPRRYPVKAEFWTTEAQWSALELLCADGLSDKATHLRQALAMYLRAAGIAPKTTPPMNGKHQEVTRGVQP